MDALTHPDSDVHLPNVQPTLLDQVGRVIARRCLRARQVEMARVAELEETKAADVVGNHAEADVPLPFTTPPSAGLTL